MKKRDAIIILFLLFLIILKFSSANSHGSETTDSDFDSSSDSSPPPVFQSMSSEDIAKLDSSTVLQYFNEIKSSGKAKFLTGKQLAFVGKEKYGDLGIYDPVALTEALKLQGFHVDSLKGKFDGAQIKDGALVLKDGSVFDLQSGKQITLDTDGQKVTFYTDNAGTTIINGIGVTVTKDAVKVKIADSVSYNSATSTKVKDFDGNNVAKTFSFASADQLIVGPTIINKVIASTITTENNQIKSAVLFTSQNNNAFTLYCNGIPFDTALSQQQSIHMNCTTVDTKKVAWFGLFTKQDPITQEQTKISVGTKKENQPITFTNSESEAFYTVTDLKTFDVEKGELNFTTDSFVEQLTGTCQKSSVEIGAEGFTVLTLKPTITLCAGARYNFLDKKKKESSFSIFNSGLADYLIGFQKGILLQEFLQKRMGIKQWGFIEDNAPQKKTTLRSVIQYDRFLSRKDLKMTEETYKNAIIPFQPVYESFDDDNTAMIVYDAEKIIISVSNHQPTAKIINKLHSGFFTFVEQNRGGTSELFFSLNKDAQLPDYITVYNRFFKIEKPAISIVEKTVIAKSINANGKETEVKIYTPETSAWSTVRAWFFASASEKLQSLISGLEKMFGSSEKK